MATREKNGGRVILSILSWLIMGCVFMGLAGFRIYREGFGANPGTLAIDLVIAAAGLGIAFVTWRGSRR